MNDFVSFFSRRSVANKVPEKIRHCTKCGLALLLPACELRREQSPQNIKIDLGLYEISKKQ